MRHPVEELLERHSEMDFAVLGHRFASHGRDYEILVQDYMGASPGTHVLTFTHTVVAECETRVADFVWPMSWTDEFTDYERWTEAGEPGGYVWGTNWSLAYPGIWAVSDSERALDWSERIGRAMFECGLETDRFFLRLIFHSINTRKISDDTNTVSSVITFIQW